MGDSELPSVTQRPDVTDAALPVAQFEALLVSARAPLYSFARSLLGDEQAAYDVTQDTFVDAWRATRAGRHPFTANADPAARRRWLFNAAYCDAISLRRHNRVIDWRSLDETPEVERALQGQQARHGAFGVGAAFDEQLAERQALRDALGALKHEDAAAILLSVVHGFSAPEIAQILMLSPDAVRKRLSRALGRLRAAYFAQADAPAPPLPHTPTMPPPTPQEGTRS